MSVKKSNSNSKKKLSSSRFISSDKPVNKSVLAKAISIMSMMIRFFEFIIVRLPVYAYKLNYRIYIYIFLAILKIKLSLTDEIYSSNKEDSKGNIIKIYKKRYINKEGDSSIKIVDNKIKVSVEKSKGIIIWIINKINILLNFISKAEHYIFYAIQFAVVISFMSYISGINTDNLNTVKEYLLKIFHNNKITSYIVNNTPMNTILTSNLQETLARFRKVANLIK